MKSVKKLRAKTLSFFTFNLYLLVYERYNLDGFLMKLLFTKTGVLSCTCDNHLKNIYEKVFGRFCRMHVSMKIQISYSNHPTNELL